MLLKKDRRQLMILALVCFLVSFGLVQISLNMAGGFLFGAGCGIVVFITIDWVKYWISGGL